VVGAALGVFSGGLLGLYLKTPGMRQDGTVRPTEQGRRWPKDIWMAGIAAALVIDDIGSRRSHQVAAYSHAVPVAPTDEAGVFVDDRRAPPAATVIFGASGDLTERKLLLGPGPVDGRATPARRGRARGRGRTDMGDDGFRKRVADASRQPLAGTRADRVRYVAGAYDDPGTYQTAGGLLDDLNRDEATAGNVLFYLSTPPQAFTPIVRGLAAVG
jgi:hypothetical protein